MQKIIFIAEREFPNGNAGGIRVLHLAKMFQVLGFSVHVYALTRSRSTSDTEIIRGVYEGVPYDLCVIPSGLKGVFIRYFSACWILGKAFRKNKQQNGDDAATAIIYSTNVFFVLSSYLNFSSLKAIWFDVVERFETENFRAWFVNPKFYFFQILYKKLYGRSRGVIAISEEIKGDFSEKTRVVKIPCLYNIKDLTFSETKVRRPGEKLKLIYSGNPRWKERVDVMLGALLELPPDLRNKLELHFTGASIHDVASTLGADRWMLEALSDVIIWHDWMDYSDLIQLYSHMDFLYFIRDDKPATRANFPMKLPELMAHGIIPITTRVGDHGLMLQDRRNSFVVSEPSATAAAGVLKDILQLDRSKLDMMRVSARYSVETALDAKEFADRNPLLKEIFTS